MEHHSYQGIRSGFSLIELLFTLGIASILSAAGASSFVHLINKAQSTTATRSIVSALQYTRSEAVGRNRVVTLCLSNNGVDCDKTSTHQLIVFLDHNNNRINDADELIRIFPFDNDSNRFEFRVSAGRNYIRYRPNGSVIDFGRIQYCPSTGDARYGSQVIVNFSGRPRLARDKDDDGIVEGKGNRNISC